MNVAVSVLLFSTLLAVSVCQTCVEIGALKTHYHAYTTKTEVKVCMEQHWIGVCLGYRAGYVTCKELGFLRDHHHYITSNPNSHIYNFQFWCFGNESRLRDCHYEKVTSCNMEVDAIRCLDDDGHGRVEVCIEGIWSTICGHDFYAGHALILCQKLHLPFKNYRVLYNYGGGTGPIYNYMCQDNGERLRECEFVRTYDCTHLDDVGIWCKSNLVPVDGNVINESCEDGQVVLVGGNGKDTGRLEYCHDGSWYTICADNWEVTGKEAQLICQSLGYHYQASAIIEYSATTSSPVIPFNVKCSHNHYELRDCIGTERHRTCNNVAGVTCDAPCLSNAYCQDCTSCYSYSNRCSCSSDCFRYGDCCPDVSLMKQCYKKQCSNGEVRLSGGGSDSVGSLEVCYIERWASVCNSVPILDNKIAKVVCRQLNFPSKDAYATYDIANKRRDIVLEAMQCTGTESELLLCSEWLTTVGNNDCSSHISINCTHESICDDGEVRLVGGVDYKSGYVEICQVGTWKIVCSKRWDIRDTRVVCRQLNFNPEGARMIGKSRNSCSDQTLLCSGTEQSLDQCTLVQEDITETCICTKISCESIPESSEVTRSHNGVTTVVGISLVLILVMTTTIVSLYIVYRFYNKRQDSPPLQPETPVSSNIELNPVTTNEACSDMNEEVELEHFVVKNDGITLMDCIGRGGFGVVYKAKLSDQLVAVKLVKVNTEEGKLDEIEQKAVKLSALKHANILEIIGICTDSGSSPYIITPFMMNGNLLKHLRRRRADFMVDSQADRDEETTKRLVSICSQITEGMEYLAAKQITHGNLAASNCLIDINFIIKITDYGINQWIFDNEVSQTRKNVHFMWMAPESLENSFFSEKSDMWSFGVTMWEIFSVGDIPSYAETTSHALLLSFQQGCRLPRPLNAACTDIMYEIMKGCWKILPEERKSFAELSGLFSEYIDHVARYVRIGFNPLKV